MSDPLAWHERFELLGVQVCAHFFEPDAADAGALAPDRLLPVLAGRVPRLLPPPNARGTYAAGDLEASPDAVLEHGNGLICLTRDPNVRNLHERGQGARALRVDLMLQAIVQAMAVAGQLQRPTVALLRCANVLYQFGPAPAVLECLASHIGAARQRWGLQGRIGPQALVAFCEPRLRAMAAGGGRGASAQCAAPGFADTQPSASDLAGR